MSAEPDYLPADALAEDEPKYLRRQKPVEIRKRKFSRKTWPLYRRVIVGGIAAIAVGFMLYEAGNYLLFSPGVMLTSPDQISIEGNRFVPREAIVEKFSADMGRSVVRVPLGQRRADLETLPWVEQARVQRVMPNRIRVEITERTPVAFLRTAGDLSLVDSQGVIFDRPAEGDFQFPGRERHLGYHAARTARAAHERVCAIHEGDRANAARRRRSHQRGGSFRRFRCARDHCRIGRRIRRALRRF